MLLTEVIYVEVEIVRLLCSEEFQTLLTSIDASIIVLSCLQFSIFIISNRILILLSNDSLFHSTFCHNTSNGQIDSQKGAFLQ